MTLKQQIKTILDLQETIEDLTEGTVLESFCEDCCDTFWHGDGGGAKCPYCGGGDTHEC